MGQCGNKDFPNIYARLEDKEILNWVKSVSGLAMPGVIADDIPQVFFSTKAISSKSEILLVPKPENVAA